MGYLKRFNPFRPIYEHSPIGSFNLLPTSGMKYLQVVQFDFDMTVLFLNKANIYYNFELSLLNGQKTKSKNIPNMEKGQGNQIQRVCMKLAQNKAMTDTRAVNQIYDRLITDMMKLVKHLGEERTIQHLVKVYPEIDFTETSQ